MDYLTAWANMPLELMESYFLAYMIFLFFFHLFWYGMQRFIFKGNAKFREIRNNSVQISGLFLMLMMMVYLYGSSFQLVKKCNYWVGTGEMCDQEKGFLMCYHPTWENPFSTPYQKIATQNQTNLTIPIPTK